MYGSVCKRDVCVLLYMFICMCHHAHREPIGWQRRTSGVLGCQVCYPLDKMSPAECRYTLGISKPQQSSCFCCTQHWIYRHAWPYHIFYKLLIFQYQEFMFAQKIFLLNQGIFSGFTFNPVSSQESQDFVPVFIHQKKKTNTMFSLFLIWHIIS